jgi:hypothetical protein
MFRFNISSIVAGTCRWQLECLDGEGEVLIIGVIDKEPVVDGLLETLGLVTGRHKGARLSSSCTLLNTSSLGKGLIVSLHSVNNNSPLAVSVDSTKRLNVSGH